MKRVVWVVAGALLVAATEGVAAKMTQVEMVQATIEATSPLKHPRGGRLPLYLWQLTGLGTEDPAEIRRLLKELDARGLAASASWNPARREESLASALNLARAQQELGLDVNVSCIRPLYNFFDGSPETAHVTAEGEKFFDTSFAEKRLIGCPFSVEHRYPVIREQVEWFVAAYAKAGVPLNFIYSDWEIDGPIEWNDGWANCKKCARCREHIPDIERFAAFQKALRQIRSDMQKRCFAEPVLRHYPLARVGNYGVYPCDGWRYWYDYFEQEPASELPFKLDQRAPYRPWYDEFAETGYTFAMPVTYTWYPIFGWYDYPNPDYRWFYNLLLVGSNAGKSTPAAVPIIDFVHWHTTSPPKEVDPNVKQMSAAAYQELLWHLLLRGHDAFFLWSPRDEAIEESKLLHEVYAASLEYAEFLTDGQPINFAVPRKQGPVVSGLRLGDRVLLRRTDFDERREAVTIAVGGRKLSVPRADGRCQVVTLKD